MRSKDIQIDTFTNSSPEARITITHIPTGTSVYGFGIRRHKLYKQLMRELKQKVETAEREGFIPMYHDKKDWILLSNNQRETTLKVYREKPKSTFARIMGILRVK